MKFKIGDKVKICNVTDHRRGYNRRVVTVTGINTNSGATRKDIPHYSVGEMYYFYEDELAFVNTQKIVITSDGTETLARLYDGNKVIKTATAKCSPDDTFNFETGARFAFDRLIESPITKALKNLASAEAKCGEAIRKSAATIEVKPHVYKEGDKVKVIANTCCHGMKIGEIVTLNRPLVVDERNARWLVKEYKDRWYIRERDFEPYKFKFEVGKQYAYNDCVIEITSARIDECNCRRYDYKEIKGNTGPIKKFTENSTFGNELKPYDPTKYYNGKVVCVSNENKPYTTVKGFTVGKVYTITDGIITADSGWCNPSPFDNTLECVCALLGNTFIPFVE